MKNKKMTLRERLGTGVLLRHAEQITVTPSESDPELSDIEFAISKRCSKIIKIISGKNPQKLFDKYCEIAFGK